MRAVRINVVVLMIMFIWAQPARADIWDWLEELTAVGPSHSRGNLTVTLHCRGQNAGWFKPLPSEDGRSIFQRTCYFADVRRFKSEEDARFFPSRIEMYEAGPMFQVIPPLEIGAGVGLMHIDSSGIKVNRMTVSLPRIVLKPLLLIPALEKKPDWGFIQLYFRETRIYDEFTEADFNTKPGYTFPSRINGDMPRSFGFMIDGTLLFRSIKHGFK
jgi:hypothetical protein